VKVQLELWWYLSLSNVSVGHAASYAERAEVQILEPMLREPGRCILATREDRRWSILGVAVAKFGAGPQHHSCLGSLSVFLVVLAAFLPCSLAVQPPSACCIDLSLVNTHHQPARSVVQPSQKTWWRLHPFWRSVGAIWVAL
jgi:hypothetical protein